ncbi:rhodanese-like domain-containing protein [Isoptericola sp. NEAU-Y5]|uniref:Rhodanese-like domain-containing protein n=1 Tax=Isoptericola luteus TaxID=2879484 RepID=A0ABS7ZA21_9MICO|nr:rhodanese-like domain-containing protein [Isoptericola sp. NEAU-Y5]MCA5891901.1 rhodanese-like domain-containing protein [Isoptericola sp. NEAU-Y5]
MFSQQPDVPTLDVRDLDAAAPLPAGATLLDVREQDEWDAGHAVGAVHIPLAQLPVRCAELDGDTQIYVVCHSGGRSAQATRFLVEAVGYDAVNLDGGMVAWSYRGLPMEA